MTKPYPKPRPRSGTALVVLVGAGPGVPKKRGWVFWGAPQTRPRSAFTVCEVDPSLAVRTSTHRHMTTVLSKRAWRTRAVLNPAPTSFATAMCFPSGVCGTLVICDCPAAQWDVSLRLGSGNLCAAELEVLPAQVLTERAERLRNDAFGVETGLGIHRRGGILVDEGVGQHHRSHLDPVEHAMLSQWVEHMRPEAADRALLDGDQYFVLAREPQEKIDVEGLGEPGIRDSCGEAQGGKLIGCLETFGKPGAEREERDLGALAHHSALPDFERLALARHCQADTFAARIAQRRRSVVDRGRGCDHVHELCLIRRRHDHEAGKAPEIGDVEGPRMGGTVSADETGAVHGKAHGQFLDGYIVHDLIVGALQKC